MHLVAIMLLITGSTSGESRSQLTSADSIAVGETIREFHASLARGDSAGVLALLADDAIVLESGGMESRAEYRGHHLPADIRFATAVPAKVGSLQIEVAGDVAWVASTSEVTGDIEGRTISSLGAELIVLTRSAKGWQIRAIHRSSRRRTNQ